MDLSATLGLSQGTAGSVYQNIDFTNLAKVACTLYGYPGVSLAGGTPIAEIGRAAVENPTPPRALITLAPGGSGSALLQITDARNYPAARCDPVPATYLQIFPPNQTTPLYLAYTATACAKPVALLHVSVVTAGKA
jgi:hypothetical protein